VRAGAMAGGFTKHYSRRNCCIRVSGAAFALTLSQVKMVVDKRRWGNTHQKKPLATTPSSVSMDLPPQMEKIN